MRTMREPSKQKRKFKLYVPESTRHSQQLFPMVNILLWTSYLIFVTLEIIVVISLFRRNIPATICILIGHMAVSWLLLGFVRIKARVLKKGTTRYNFSINQLPRQPSVTIMIPVCNEPVSILAETFKAVTNISWPDTQIIIIENSTCQRLKSETIKLVDEFNLPIHNVVNRGSKAAALNDSLSLVQSEFILLLDADIVPVPEILSVLVSEILSDEDLSFVQAPQAERNVNESFVTIGMVAQQIHFYEHFCEGFGNGLRSLCVGTNCLFRSRIVRAVGGWPENTVTEDVAMSYRLHKANYKSTYVNYRVGYGLAPVTMKSYFNQRARYAEGGFALLCKVLSNLYTDWKNGIHINSWQFDYLFAFSYYFISIVYFAYWVSIPAFWATNHYHPRSDEPLIQIVAGALAFVCIQLILIIDMPRRGYRIRDLLSGQGMTILSVPAYLVGILNGFRRRQIKFVITKKKISSCHPQTSTSIFFRFCLILTLFFPAIAWYKNYIGDSITFWLIINATLLILPAFIKSGIDYRSTFYQKNSVKRYAQSNFNKTNSADLKTREVH